MSSTSVGSCAIFEFYKRSIQYNGRYTFFLSIFLCILQLFLCLNTLIVRVPHFNTVINCCVQHLRAVIDSVYLELQNITKRTCFKTTNTHSYPRIHSIYACELNTKFQVTLLCRTCVLKPQLYYILQVFPIEMRTKYRYYIRQCNC